MNVKLVEAAPAKTPIDEVIDVLRAHARAQVCTLEPKDCRALSELLLAWRARDAEAEWKKAHDAACKVIELQRRTIDEQAVKIAALEQQQKALRAALLDAATFVAEAIEDELGLVRCFACESGAGHAEPCRRARARAVVDAANTPVVLGGGVKT